jgi:hypothetical protein
MYDSAILTLFFGLSLACLPLPVSTTSSHTSVSTMSMSSSSDLISLRGVSLAFSVSDIGPVSPLVRKDLPVRQTHACTIRGVSQFSPSLTFIQSKVDGNGVTGNGLPPNPSPFLQKQIISDFFSGWLLVPDNPLPVTPLPQSKILVSHSDTVNIILPFLLLFLLEAELFSCLLDRVALVI